MLMDWTENEERGSQGDFHSISHRYGVAINVASRADLGGNSLIFIFCSLLYNLRRNWSGFVH